MALPIIAACFTAVTTLIVKSLSRTEAPAAIVTYMNLLLTPLSLLPALFVWRWPTPTEWALGLFIGLCAALAHNAFTPAFVQADPSAQWEGGRGGKGWVSTCRCRGAPGT